MVWSAFGPVPNINVCFRPRRGGSEATPPAIAHRLWLAAWRRTWKSRQGGRSRRRWSFANELTAVVSAQLTTLVALEQLREHDPRRYPTRRSAVLTDSRNGVE
jgi:hypothetical protein